MNSCLKNLTGGYKEGDSIFFKYKNDNDILNFLEIELGFILKKGGNVLF
jgi:hypothetical protein